MNRDTKLKEKELNDAICSLSYLKPFLELAGDDLGIEVSQRDRLIRTFYKAIDTIESFNIIEKSCKYCEHYIDLPLAGDCQKCCGHCMLRNKDIPLASKSGKDIFNTGCKKFQIVKS